MTYNTTSSFGNFDDLFDDLFDDIDDLFDKDFFGGNKNFPPHANNDSFHYSESEDGGVYDGNNLLKNDYDPNGDRLHITHVNGSYIGNGKWIHLDKGDVFVNKDGRIDFDANGDFDFLKKGQTSSVKFNYKVSDGRGGTDKAWATLNVKGEGKQNTAPNAKDDFAMTDADQNVHFNVLKNDSDPDGDRIFVKALEGEDLAADGNNKDRVIGDKGGQFTIFDDGSLKFNPRHDFEHLRVGESVVTTADYTISDGKGGHDTATISIQVKGTKQVNQAPIAKDDSAMTDEGQAVKINVLGNDSDPDGDAIRVSSLENASNGSVKLNNDGKITYTPNDGFVGKDSFDYHISDGKGGTDTASVHVQVKDVNEAPIAKDDSAMTDEGQSIKINVLGNDSDPDGDAINVSSLEDASNGSVNLNNDGSVTYTPDAGFVGKDSFDYHISDGNGGTDTASVHVQVKDVPDEKNLIKGNDKNNHLNGTDGNDTIKGFGGWDTLNGNGGDDHLIGGAGLDTLNGGTGKDVINGTDAVNAGAGERDHATGGSGMDTFILGDANQAYYTADGNRDFLRIDDFEVGVDKVQLSGSRSDYHVEGNKLCLSNGETIAIFDNLETININSGDFEFV